MSLPFVKIADDSAVLKLFSETFFSLSSPFVHTHLQGVYLVGKKIATAAGSKVMVSAGDRRLE